MSPILTIEHEGILQLQAGQAHGVCDGDNFTVCPLSLTEIDSNSKGDLVIAKITRSRALTLDLEPLKRTPLHVQLGWIAKPLTRVSLRRFPIRLASGLPHPDEWLTAIKERLLHVHIGLDKDPFSFHVLLNGNKEYESLDESDQKIINLPTMKQSQTDTSHVCDIMEHLARFKLVREIANKASVDSFRESFNVQLTSSSGETFHPGCLVKTEQDNEAKITFELIVENKGNNDLYLRL